LGAKERTCFDDRGDSVQVGKLLSTSVSESFDASLEWPIVVVSTLPDVLLMTSGEALFITWYRFREPATLKEVNFDIVENKRIEAEIK
jgi:hypothetical protein